MIEMEFIGGPLDGTREMRPEEIRPTLRVPAAPEGYYRLARQGGEPDEAVAITGLSLTAKEIKEHYQYFWITKETRGKAAIV